MNALTALCLRFSSLSVTSPVNLDASTSDWPQWRGPKRDGISQENGLLKQWPAEGPKVTRRISFTRRPALRRPLMETFSTRWARTATSSASKPGAARFAPLALQGGCQGDGADTHAGCA